MKIIYENNKIKDICELEEEMDKFFSHNKLLIDNLKVLMFHLERIENINELRNAAFIGYNYEKVEGSKNKYSLRIVPKRRKSEYRMYVEPQEKGIKINIITIDKHKYRIK